MQSISIRERGLTVARAAQVDPHHSFAFVAGLQYESNGDTRRTVSLSFHGKGTDWEGPLYASVYLSPDEARGLAYRLLDEADTADEDLDAPVDLVPTGKA